MKNIYRTVMLINFRRPYLGSNVLYKLSYKRTHLLSKMCSVTTCSFKNNVYLHPPSPTSIISGYTFLRFVVFYASLACVAQLSVTLQVMLSFFLTEPS